mmetsp:Transcript_81218/g.181734  ORF Transcript_81218/g.181734 Transcript_81218/m.181734 type:complete len:151 (-) Transcript_81218:228-680(-)
MGQNISGIPEQWADRKFVLHAVKKDGTLLRQASEELRRDHEIVLAAVNADGIALAHASDDLRGDPEIVTAAVKNNGMALQYASEVIRANHDIAQLAVQQNPEALHYAAKELKRGDSDLKRARMGHTDHTCSTDVNDSKVKTTLFSYRGGA